ncbi:Bug family tripartite tricarboxylate transporter substrate binding protein [Enterovirga aerilata]|uniref:Tripartite tricarboxylate transporter substrate binding protein n=1 Tax=Enterovirga aerilata TaxID=2730920 RepID=A0A849I9M4_9HYPH|nr:tripartite tricarboxylate transporter substrate binding protein [Enterovirga sp. DB1703]NNM73109.1 tripartite tricarboxylate transporter substrate binding protein [Enterovirga sp. DB1703]
MIDRRRMLLRSAGATAVALAGGRAWAQGWAPSRTVTIVVPYPAGGAVDVLARIVAEGIQGPLGQSVVVENQPGASGALGTRRVARSEPDGHTLVLSTNQTHATNISLLPDGGGYDPIRDFAPLAGLADLQHLLVVRKDLPAEDVAGLLSLARSSGRELTCGSTGPGSASHLTMELFKAQTGTNLVHVPYRGAAPMLQDLIGGRVDMSFATVPTVLGQVQGQELRALGVASPRPSPHLPDLPTLAGAGVPGVEADAWCAIFAPAGIAPAIRDRYRDLIKAALDRPEVQANIAKQGMSLNWREPDAFAAFQREEVTRWAGIIKAAKIEPPKP